MKFALENAVFFKKGIWMMCTYLIISKAEGMP